MTCLSCGFQLSEELIFCPKCGSPATRAGSAEWQPEPVPEPPESIEAPLSWRQEQPGQAAPSAEPEILYAWSREEDPKAWQDTPPVKAAPVASSPPPEYHMAQSLSHAANAAKHAAGVTGQAVHSGVSHAAEAAKTRWDEAGGMDGIKDHAKKFAEKSGTEAKILFGNSYVKARPFVNSKNILTAVIVALALIVLLIIFGMGSRNAAAAILLSGFTAALVIAVYTRVRMPSGGTVHPAKMQTLNAAGYTYLLTASGDVYRIKDGIDLSTRLDVSGVTGMFSDHDRIFACKRDGSLVTALHGSNGASEILPAGTILCGIADVSTDGYVYFSSAKVQGSPICRVRAGGGAVHIVTE